MAAKKKTAVAENVTNVETVENAVKSEENDAADKNVELEGKNGKLTLGDVAEIVNAIVDSVFVERNGKIEFAVEYYEVLLAYFQIGAFYPETGVFDDGIGLFFMNYIDDKYYRELDALDHNNLAKYIKNAVVKKIEAKMRQIENPLVNSLVKFVDVATVLAGKYIDDIDNVGSADIKRFIADFSEVAKKTNTNAITDAMYKLHQKEAADAAVSADKAKPAVKKQGARAKKTGA